MKKKKNNSAKKGKKTANKSLGRKVLTVFGGLVALGVLVVLITILVTAIKVGKINEESLYSNIERSSILYDINGTEIDTLHYTEDRTIVPIQDVRCRAVKADRKVRSHQRHVHDHTAACQECLSGRNKEPAQHKQKALRDVYCLAA